jgi:capsular exopolysaccharide synthesis family protein
VLCAIAAWLLIPASFSCYALLNVSPSDRPIVRINAVPTYGTGEFATYIKTQVDTVKTHFVLTAALRDKKVADLPTLKDVQDPIKYLEDNLIVENAAGSQLIRISLAGDRPEDLGKIVNAVYTAFLQEVVEAGMNGKRHELVKVEEIYKKKHDELQKVMKQFNDAQENGSLLPATNNFLNQQMVLQRSTALNSELTKVRLERAQTSAQLERLKLAVTKGDDPTLFNDAEFESVLDKDAEYQRLKKSADLAGQRKKYFQEKYENDKLGLIAQSTEEERKAQELLAEYKTKTREKTLAALTKRRSTDMAGVQEDLQVKLDILLSHEKSLDKQIEALPPIAAPNDRTPTVPVDQASMMADIRQREKTLDKITETIDGLKLEVSSPARVTPFQPASAPMQKDFKKRILATLMAAFLGFALIGGLVVGYETLTQRVFGTIDLGAQLGLPVLGSLPTLIGQRKGSANDPRSRERFDDAVDQVRAVAINRFIARNVRTILITSAADHEGKTLLTCHLALSLMRAGKRVLVLDCNVRSPRVHDFFGAPLKPGLCEILRGEVPAGETVHRLTATGPWFIPAGSYCPAVREELSKDKFRKLLDKLTQEFDYILLDSHAVPQVADTQLIAPYVDAVVLTARKYQTRLPELRDSVRKLTTVGAPDFALVLVGDELTHTPAVPRPVLASTTPQGE